MTTKTSVFATNDIVTASDMNAVYGAWNSYTPTLTQSGTVSKTVTYAKYRQFGKTVKGSVLLAVTGSGTTNNPVLIGLPVASQATTGLVMGSGDIVDSSAGQHYVGAVVSSSTTTVGIVAHAQSTWVGNAPNFALASGDTVRVDFEYETA